MPGNDKQAMFIKLNGAEIKLCMAIWAYANYVLLHIRAIML